MKYKKVEINENSSSKPLEDNKKIIFYEYIFYSIISIFLAIYCTLNLGIISYNLAEKYNFRLNGLVKGYSFLSGHRDLSDFQWRYYRENLPLIILFATIFVSLSQLIKRHYKFEILKYYYLIFGLGYAFFLHRIKIIYLIIILFSSYLLCCNYSFLGKRYFILLTWIFSIFIKVTSEIWNGYSIDFLNISDFLKDPLLGWQSVFGLNMLKIISFNMEYANTVEKDGLFNNKLNNEKIREPCKDCIKGKFCLSGLKFVNASREDFSFFNLLIYIFYPPFYFSGPTIMFHSFIFQINNYNTNKHNYIFKNKILYFIKCIFIFITLEIFNHYIYVNAIMTNKYNSWIFEEFRNSNSYFYYTFLAFNNLVFIFLKFALIWSIARFWGWADGIYAEENMNRCIYYNYC